MKSPDGADMKSAQEDGELEQVWTFPDETKRETWPRQDGPWAKEPDKAQWTDKDTGLICIARRAGSLGHWCGYVGVPKGHPLYGVYYGDCTQDCGQDLCEHRPESFLRVHGGITYSDPCQEKDKERGVCHVAPEGEPPLFWFGFDCAHAGDLSPGYQDGSEEYMGTYKSLRYVRRQCATLARQLKAIA